jgi:regulator of protease activity HflC (stomatin/prohibitin superfamily)
MWFVAAVVVVAVIAGLRWRRYFDPRTRALDAAALTADLARTFAAALVAAFLLTFAGDVVVIVPAGHRGVVFDIFKGVREKPLGEGMNFILPVVQRATVVDVRVQKIEIGAKAASRDLQDVHTNVALTLFPAPDRVAALYRDIGLNYESKIVRPAVNEVLKAATARYTAEELITKRDRIKQDLHEGLLKLLTPLHLNLQDSFITDFKFSPEFARAIEQKQVAAQEAQKASNDLSRIRIEAEQKIARAKAEAQALRMQREAITPQLLDLRRIEMQKAAIAKWNGTMPEVVQGGSLPFLDLNMLQRGARRAAPEVP